MMNNFMNGMFGKIGSGMCKLSMSGNIAVKTSNGYKSYNVKSGKLTNCGNFVFPGVDENFFFVIPTNKVAKGDIILVNGKPKCVIEADKTKITVINYEDSTVETILPERHVFMGNTYFYGKIVSMFGSNLGKDKNSANKIFKYMMMSQMMNGAAGTGTGTDSNPMSAMMPFMMMNGGIGDVFDGMFDFSMVSDTYDYWNMIDNILPACKKEIMQHNGKLLVRPDSGDMVEIAVETIEKIWNTFGGTVNSKGYKVLDSHIGIIYGDGCTLNNVEQVWEELKKKGFAANNIVFGVGAFCFSAIVEPDGHMVVVTRDMFGIAMKATYGIVNGEPIMIYKDPKTDTSHLKKSHKGCCCIYYDDNGELQCEDGYNDVFRDGALSTVFVDGKACNKETFEDIRERLNGGNKDE